MKKVKTKSSKPLSINKEERTIQVVMTTNEIDRDSDIVETRGIDTKSFEQNPVVLWAHNPSMPPIGVVTEIEKMDNMMIGTVKFADTERGNEIFKLYEDGIMKTWSIGFRGTQIEHVKDADNNVLGYHFKQSELYELSAVPIPANPSAMVKAFKTIKDEDLKKELQELIEAEKTMDGYISIGKELSICLKQEDGEMKKAELESISTSAFSKTSKELSKVPVSFEFSEDAVGAETKTFFDVLKKNGDVITECKIKSVTIVFSLTKAQTAPLTPTEPSRTATVAEGDEEAKAKAVKATEDTMKAMFTMRESILKSIIS